MITFVMIYFISYINYLPASVFPRVDASKQNLVILIDVHTT